MRLVTCYLFIYVCSFSSVLSSSVGQELRAEQKVTSSSISGHAPGSKREKLFSQQQPRRLGPPNQPEYPDLVVQTGHADALFSVAISADSKLIASGGRDEIIKLWDAATGTELRTLTGHQGAIRALAFNPTGKILASGSDDHTVKLWDATAGTLLNSIEGPSGSVNSIAISPNGELLAIAGSGFSADDPRNFTIKLWDLRTGKIARLFGAHFDNVESVAFSPDGTQIAAANSMLTGRGKITLWEVATGKVVRAIAGDGSNVNTIAFSPNGKTLASGSWNSVIKLWDLQTGKQLFSVGVPVGDAQSIPDTLIHSVAFSIDGKFIAAGRRNGNVEIRNSINGDLVTLLQGHTGVVRAVVFSPDRKTVVTCGDDKSIRFWNLQDGSEFRRLAGRNDSISAIAISPDGNWVTSAGGNDNKVWSLLKGTMLGSIKGQVSGVESSAFSPDGKLLAVGGYKGVDLWDLAGETYLRFLSGHTDSVVSIVFTGNGHSIVTASRDSTIKFWDISTGKLVRSIHVGDGATVYSAASSADSKLIATGSHERLALWEATTGKLLRSVDPNPRYAGFVKAVAFDPSGEVLASGTSYGEIKLWSVTSGKLLHSLTSAAGNVYSITFSSDGKVFASGGDDGIIKLWDVTTGAKIGSLKQNTVVSSVAFTPNGKWLLSGSIDGSIRLWNFRTGELLASMIALDEEWTIATPDGRFNTNKNLDFIEDLHWRFQNSPLVPVPLEIFMRDYYEPRLLRRILKGETLPQLPSLAGLNRIQPVIERIDVKPHTDNANVVDVTVKVASVTGQCLRDGKPINCESGVYDLHLYRDGQLVQQAPGANETSTNLAGADWRQQLQQWRQTSLVKNKAGKAITAAAGPQEITFTNIPLPKRTGVSQVEFTAYAFNEDRVKSATSKPAVYSLPQPRPGAPRRAFLITVGVDVTSAGWRLRFARKGVTEIEALLKKSLHDQQYQVVPVQLLSAYQKNSDELLNLATKRNIQTVLNILSGREVSKADREKIPQQEQLQSATPDDLVVLYIASHGYVDPAGKFYVLPADLGPPLGVSEELLDRCLKHAEQSSQCENGRRLLQHGIASEELTQWLEAIDAGQMVLILDSCHSGAVTGPDFKPGPMGDRSFGQLSYDKGMLVLAAAQAEQLDTGTLALGNRSLLTYALTQQPAGPVVDLRQWLSAAEQRVPKLYQQFVKADSGSSDADQEPALFDFSKRKGQTP